VGLGEAATPTTGLPGRQRRNKLGSKFFGSYQVVERLGIAAYRPQLPARAKLHDVFHVGMLKRSRGDPPAAPVPLPPIRHGCACLELEMAFKSRLARGRHELLVQWKGPSRS
jgi:hypothetical protein